MSLRSYIVPLGIGLAAFFGGAALAKAATTTPAAPAKKKNGNGKSTAVSRLVPKGGAVDIKHTEPSSLAQDWARQRYQTSVDYLKGIGVDADTADKLSLSALAHWAMETGTGDVTTAGANEFNYNVGGIHARDGDQYFNSTDQGKPTKFAAYDSASQGIGDYWALLAAEYADCLKMLKDDPTSSAWMKCLGQKGYYGTDADATAKTWSSRRSDLEPNITAYKASGVSQVQNAKKGKVNGDDKSKTYGPYTDDQVDALLTKARAIMTVTGSNPYVFDPNKAGVKLSATHQSDGHVIVTVTDKAWYVPYGKIWENIDKIMP